VDEKELHEPEPAQFIQFLDMSPDATVMVNKDGIITVANTLAGALFGYDPSEMAGMSVEQLIPERFRNIHPGHRKGFFWKPAARAMGENLQLYGLRSDGREFAVEIALKPVTWEGKPQVLAIVRVVPLPVVTLQGMITQTVSPMMERVGNLEVRMSKIETSYERNRELLEGIHSTVNSVSHFTANITRFAKATGLTLIGAVIIAVVVAWVLQRLHLK